MISRTLGRVFASRPSTLTWAGTEGFGSGADGQSTLPLPALTGCSYPHCPDEETWLHGWKEAGLILITLERTHMAIYCFCEIKC